jgi:predicted metal-dependent HD superfamily phosphohydrolase
MSAAAVITKCPVNGIAAVPSTQSPAPTPRLFEAGSSSEMVKEIIRKHWRSLEGSYKPSAWDALEGGYGDARRAYHSWEHIAELLEKLDEFRALSAKPALIATAVFWHDAVYATRAADGGKRSDLENVRDSAELFLRHTLLNADDAAAVHELIMATADHTRAEPKKAHYHGFAGDLDLFLDLDLSPLAAPWETFAANLENIRFEFTWVPEREFYSSQIDMLEGFLKADAHLFRRAETRKKWLAAAKDNLRYCIDELRARFA